ncbi:hypothetical protein P261_00314 [Lachnospiraceae bacterium TWA4]|nr:hypothetical protein P261_00314 [Lachnospiraceae bacterium TWA4]
MAFIIGINSITIRNPNFFLTTKYFKSPLDAYNDVATYNYAEGKDGSAESEIGIVKISDSNVLFIGKVDDENFVVSEMQTKNGQFVVSGANYIIDLNVELNSNDREIIKTKTDSGIIEWSITLKESDIPSDENISVEQFPFGSDHTIFFVIYK